MTKIKIAIKHFLTGSILFEYESENNTVLQTVKEAVRLKTYLTGAYLTGADLTGADLTGAYLTGADLTGAYLRGADLRGNEKIQKAAVFTGLYTYAVIYHT